MIWAGSASASTDILLSPATINVAKNRTFNVTVNVDPKGNKNGAITVQLKYPANLLEATNFSFGGNWLELPGSNQIDNVNGVLVKTLGYKGGVTNNVVFGTVTFKAKNNGNGKISVGSDSLAYDANSQNVFSGLLQSVDVTIGAAAAATPAPTLVGTVGTPTPTPKVAVVSGQKKGTNPSVTPSPSSAILPESINQTATKQGSLFANISSILTLGTGNKLVGIVVALVVIALIYYIVKKIVRGFKKETSV